MESAAENLGFPTLEKYQASPEFMRRRQNIIDNMKALREVFVSVEQDNVIRGHDGSIVFSDENERKLYTIYWTMRREWAQIKLAPYLDTEGNFTAVAKKDPDIMLSWVAHDLMNIAHSGIHPDTRNNFLKRSVPFIYDDALAVSLGE